MAQIICLKIDLAWPSISPSKSWFKQACEIWKEACLCKTKGLIFGKELCASAAVAKDVMF